MSKSLRCRTRPWSVALLLLVGFSLPAQAQLGPASALFSANHEDTLYGSALLAADINGDGYEDLVASGRNIGDLLPANGGGVQVFFGGSCSLSFTLLYSQENFGYTTQAGDYFGYSLAAGHFNDDPWVDVAFGIPGQTVSGQANAGAVLVVYGEEGGLDVDHTEVYSQANLAGAVEAGDFFGSALAVADFDLNGIDDLAIGAVLEDVGAVGDAGAVHVVFGQAGGLSTIDNQIRHQGVTGVSNDPQFEDFFGAALAVGDLSGDGFPDLAVGIPGESIDAQANAGAVQVFFGGSDGISTSTQFWHQSVPGVLGSAQVDDELGSALATGDFNGDGRTDLAIGVPGDQEGGGLMPPLEAGLVHVLYGDDGGGGLSAVGDQRFFSGLLGPIHAFDHFGSTLVAGDFDGNGASDLAIGAPLDNQLDDQGQGVVNSGAVRVLYGGAGGLSLVGSAIFTAELAGSSLQAGEELGTALAAGTFRNPGGGSDLAIGAPGRAGSSGANHTGRIYAAFGAFPFVDGFESGNLCAWSEVFP